jgi:hypothetical protein
MTVGLYKHGLNSLASRLAQELEELGITVERGDCLCEYPYIEEEILPDRIMIHPADNDSCNCWSKLKDIIAKNEDVNFYVFALGAYEREEGIGKFPNLKYINHANVDKVFDEIVASQ